MQNDRKYDIFLSYSRSDFETVERIARYLDDIGLTLWLDKWCFVPGQRWQAEI